MFADEFFLFFKALYENHDPAAVARNPRIPTTMPTIPPTSRPLRLPELELPLATAEVVAVGESVV